MLTLSGKIFSDLEESGSSGGSDNFDILSIRLRSNVYSQKKKKKKKIYMQIKYIKWKVKMGVNDPRSIFFTLTRLNGD